MTSTNYCMKLKTQLQVVAKQYQTERSSLWSRDRLTCDTSLNATEREKKLVNYKTTVRETNNRSTYRLSKKQQYNQLAKGFTLHGNSRVTYATQNETITIPMIQNLVKTGPSSYYYCEGIPPGWTGFFGSEYIVNIVGELTSSNYVNHISKSKLKEVIVGSNVSSIGTQAFYQCSLLPSIIIPSSVSSLGNEAFHNCQNLTSVIISPDSSLNYIGNSCFKDSSLNSLTYKDTIYYAEEHFTPVFSGTIGTAAFNNTPFENAANSVSIFTSTSNTKFYTLATVIEQTTYASNILPLDLSKFEIASSVTSLGNEAFYDCQNLTSLIISPDSSLNHIGTSCFEDSSLTRLTYKDIIYYKWTVFASNISSGIFNGVNNHTIYIAEYAFNGTPFYKLENPRFDSLNNVPDPDSYGWYNTSGNPLNSGWEIYTNYHSTPPDVSKMFDKGVCKSSATIPPVTNPFPMVISDEHFDQGTTLSIKYPDTIDSGVMVYYYELYYYYENINVNLLTFYKIQLFGSDSFCSIPTNGTPNGTIGIDYHQIDELRIYGPDALNVSTLSDISYSITNGAPLTSSTSANIKIKHCTNGNGIVWTLTNNLSITNKYKYLYLKLANANNEGFYSNTDIYLTEWKIWTTGPTYSYTFS